MNRNKYIDLEEQVYFLIHSIDCNVKPSVLSIGSMLFKFDFFISCINFFH